MKTSFIRKARGGALAWLMFLICIAAIGGGIYFYLEKERKAREEQLALVEAEKRKQAELDARRRAEEQHILALKQEERRKLAEAERLRLEEERKRLAEEERLRRLAEEEERRRRLANQKKDKPEDRPAEKDPRHDIFDKPLVITGLSASGTLNEKLWANMLETLCRTNGWSAFKPALAQQLMTELKKSVRLDEFKMDIYDKSPLLQQIIAIHNILGKLPDENLRELNGDGETPIAQSFLHYLLSNRDNALINLQRSLTGKEEAGEIYRILSTWKELWTLSSPEIRVKYQPLAIACALVKPDKRERCKVKNAEPMSMEEVYAAFCESAEAGKLKTDITKLLPTDLIYVVNIGLPRSEMEWAQKNVRLTRRNWKAAYPMIRYRMDKATKGLSLYTVYTFEEILKEGGVCADQGYFAANTARCNGIPAAYVTGDGNLGAHAWFIYMDSDNSWSSAGRYASYTTGRTVNPQTGQRVHESVLEMRSRGGVKIKDLQKTQDIVMMHQLFASLDMHKTAQKLLLLAQQTTPTHPLPWQTTIDYYQSEGVEPGLSQWEELCSNLRKYSKTRPDFVTMAEEIDAEFIRPNKDSSLAGSSLTDERKAITRANKDGRVDLIVQALKRETDYLIENNQLDKADQAFRDSIRKNEKRIDALKSIYRDYYDFAKNHEKYLPTALRYMERTYTSKVETGSTFYFTVKQETGLIKQVAGYYRSSGQDKKADKLEKEADERYQKSKGSS